MKKAEALTLLLQQEREHNAQLMDILKTMILQGGAETAQDEGPPAHGLPGASIHQQVAPIQPEEHTRAYR